MDEPPTCPEPGAKSNEQEKGELQRLNLATASLTSELDQCQVAVTNLQAKLSEAQAAIQKQHEILRALEAKRDEFWKKLKDVAKNRKELVNKYTYLVTQIRKNQSPEPG